MGGQLALLHFVEPWVLCAMLFLTTEKKTRLVVGRRYCPRNGISDGHQCRRKLREKAGRKSFPRRWPAYRRVLSPAMKITALSVFAPQDSTALVTAEPTAVQQEGCVKVEAGRC